MVGTESREELLRTAAFFWRSVTAVRQDCRRAHQSRVRFQPGDMRRLPRSRSERTAHNFWLTLRAEVT